MQRIITLFTVLLFLSACFDKPKQLSTPSQDIPDLLHRNEKIQNGKEWERVQNIYGAALNKINHEKEIVEPYIKLAEVYINEARITGEHGHYYPGALKVLDQALSIPKINQDQKFRALAYKASVMLSQHEFSEALEIAKTAVAINPHNAQIYGALVDAYVELGDYKKAVAMADKMVNIRPDLRSYSRVSYLRQIHGDINGAIEAMKLAVDAGYPGEEQTAWTRLTLGELYEKNEDFESAKIQYQTILQERANYPFAIAALAEIHRQKGEDKKAESLLNRAIDIIPEVGFYEQMAAIYKSQNRTEEFEKIKEEIFLMLEDDVQSGHNMNLEYANLYIDLIGDYNKALTYAEEEYHKRPDNIDVNKMLAMIYYKTNHAEKAKLHTEKAFRTGAIFPELTTTQSLTSFNQ